MIAQTTIKPSHASVRAELKAQRRQVLDKMTTTGIFGYLAYRHRVFLLASGYPVIAGVVIYCWYR